MQDILKYIKLGQKINQSYYEDAMQKAYEQIKEPTERQKVEYHHNVYGGNCPICLKPWIKKEMINKVSNYFFYKADCNCYDLKQDDYDNEYEEKLSYIAEKAGVPSKYIKCSIKKMDKKTIKKETLTAIKFVEDYINKKIFDKGIIIHGSPGTGKTHLSVAVLKAVAYIKGWSAIYVRMSSFINNIRESEKYIKEVLKYKIILLNDMDKATIGNKTESIWVNDRIFELFEGINEDNKFLIGTTNVCDANKLNELFDPAVTSRILSSCHLVEIKGDDYRLNHVI